MTKSKDKCERFTLDGYADISPDEVERRTQFAKMRALELSVLKDELSLADKAGELCRIDVALDAFNNFLIDFVRMMRQFPDKVQSIVPEMTPDQYGELRQFIDETLQRFSEARLHLTIESTKTEKALATQAKDESNKKSAKLKKGD